MLRQDPFFLVLFHILIGAWKKSSYLICVDIRWFSEDWFHSGSNHHFVSEETQKLGLSPLVMWTLFRTPSNNPSPILERRKSDVNLRSVKTNGFHQKTLESSEFMVYHGICGSRSKTHVMFSHDKCFWKKFYLQSGSLRVRGERFGESHSWPKIHTYMRCIYCNAYTPTRRHIYYGWLVCKAWFLSLSFMKHLFFLSGLYALYYILII